MRRLLLCAWLAAFALAPSAMGASARVERRVEVRVVDVAGGRAYLQPGAAEGIQVGDSVQIGGRRFSVLGSNSKNAVIALGDGRLARGQRGSVKVRVVELETFATRARPKPLEAYAAKWRPAALPADAQHPRHVPLGVMTDSRSNRLALSVDHQRIVPLSGSAAGIGRTRLRALLHARFSGVPVTFDGDAYAELWQATDLDQRPENASRPIVNVRQLELGYQGEVLQGSAGRLRHASRTLGMLDGARASARLGEDWSLGAFGGTLADPRDGSLLTDASRFGLEIGWRDATAAARPGGSITLYGSRFQGRTDERRVRGLFEAYPEFGRIGAHAELSWFDADNPWAADPFEVSAAGADASVRLDELRLGLSLDMRRPERSLFLASFLPLGYFCVQQAIAGSFDAEPCADSAERYTLLGSVGWQSVLWTLDAGATVATTRGVEAAQTALFSSFQRRELLGRLRFDAGATLSRGSIIESIAFDAGLGYPLGDDTADVSAHYRPSVVRYRADQDEFVEHGVGARLWWALGTSFDLSGSAEVISGRDVDVLSFQLGLSWRPRF